MIQASYTEVEPLQLLIVRYSRTIFLSYFYTSQTFKLNSQGKSVFEINHLPLEVVDKVCGARLIVGLFSIIMKHEFHKSAFGQHRGKPRDRDYEDSLIQRAHALEQSPTLLIDCCRNRIRKMRKTWIAVTWRGSAHCIDVNHPSIVK
ncbi:hypothetical protein P910_002390 [Xylella fastidiosa Mul-MD]|nr:hypothetical protein P910_002390 [Xylella fastidiosa Mul-MD]